MIIISFALVLDSCWQDKLFAQYAGQGQAQPSGQQQPQGQANQPLVQGSANDQAAAKTEKVKKTLTAAVPVLEIKRLETEEPLYSFELRDVDITDLFRVLAHDYKLNLMVDKDVQGTVTASLTNVSLEEALETIAESHNLILKKKANITKVVPNLITKTFTLKYVEAKNILESSGSSSTSTTEASS